jgi:hypothetical protein
VVVADETTRRAAAQPSTVGLTAKHIVSTSTTATGLSARRKTGLTNSVTDETTTSLFTATHRDGSFGDHAPSSFPPTQESSVGPVDMIDSATRATKS